MEEPVHLSTTNIEQILEFISKNRKQQNPSFKWYHYKMQSEKKKRETNTPWTTLKDKIGNTC